MEHCFLCGISLPACKNRRYKPTQELQRFVQASCQATPMAFAYKTIHDNVNEISQERRNGYGWYRDSPKRVLEHFKRWSAAHPA